MESSKSKRKIKPSQLLKDSLTGSELVSAAATAALQG